MQLGPGVRAHPLGIAGMELPAGQPGGIIHLRAKGQRLLAGDDRAQFPAVGSRVDGLGSGHGDGEPSGDVGRLIGSPIPGCHESGSSKHPTTPSRESPR